MSGGPKQYRRNVVVQSAGRRKSDDANRHRAARAEDSDFQRDDRRGERNHEAEHQGDREWSEQSEEAHCKPGILKGIKPAIAWLAIRSSREAGAKDGGPPGDRTRDTLIKSQVLYH